MLPQFLIHGATKLSQDVLNVERESARNTAAATWSGFREEYQPIGLYKVTSTYAAPDYTVGVVPLDITDSQDGQENPAFSSLQTEYEERAFNLGGWKLEANNLVICTPVSVEDGKPYLAAIPTPQSGVIETWSAVSGETDIWEYEVLTATGTVSNVRNIREEGNTSTHFQNWPRSDFPSFECKAIGEGERVQLLGAYIDIPNLVACDA